MGSITDVTPPIPALDFSAFDTDVRVQDDLFRHVNGAWIERTPIPDDKPLTGSFMVLRDAAEEAVRDIITGMDRTVAPDGSDEAKIADLYASFLDTDAIEAAGAQPLSEVFARIDAVTEVPELIELMGASPGSASAASSGVDTESDPGDPERYVMFVGQSGLGLPDEALLPRGRVRRGPRRLPGHIGRMLEIAEVDYPAHPGPADLRAGDRHRGLSLGQGEDPGPAADVQPDVADRVQRRQCRAALAYVHGRRRHRRAAHGRAGRGAAVLLHRGRRPADRRPAADLEGLAEVAGRSGRTRRICRAPSWTRTSPSTAPPCRARPSCGSAGSGASPWSRAPWARPSARSTSSGTSRRWPSSGWTSWWPT